MPLRRYILPLLLLALFGAGETALAGPMRVFRSQHYVIHTDLDTGVAQDLARRMDAMYAEYTRRLDKFGVENAVAPSEAFLFAKRNEYLSFGGGNLRSTGGLFMPGRNVLAAFLETQGRDSLRRTLQHEAFHQFAYLAISDHLPIWLNEGMAQYFEEGLWTGDGFLLAQVPPRRLRQLKADITARRLVPFREFMAMSPDDWARTLALRGESRGATQYNQAWAMVYFLANATDASGQPVYRQRLMQMLELIHKGSSGKAAFETAFSSNYEGFQTRFLEFVRTLKPTPEATYIEQQEVLGDMLIALREHGRTVSDIASFRDTVRRLSIQIQYSKGQIKWTTQKQTGVYFSDLAGRPFDASELYFGPRRSAPLPEIICRFSRDKQLRTRFYNAGAAIEHETCIEPAPANATPFAAPRP